MVPAAFDYAAPTSLEEALDLLAERSGEAKVLAGGQSLIPMMRFRLAQPKLLVDIGRIEELSYIQEEDGLLRIGALTRHGEMERSPLIRRRYPLLGTTAAQVADPIVRNLGTVVGSLLHADPAGDWAAALLAARAEVVLRGSGGRVRVVPLTDFFSDTFTTVALPDELAVEVRLPAAPPRASGDYQKIERKVGDFATAAVGVQLQLTEDGKVAEIGIGLAAVGPTTLRAKAAEDALLGEEPTEERIQQAAELAAQTADPVADSRGSAEYKRDMIRVLTTRALRNALRRLGTA